mmetsp:Transcript_59151/g.138385  ORF Transcript_59151/g.138385 Transcript_59151/m.138385 type:complete len:337 (-) Transcript_59151:575-1585(-)
MSETPTAPLPSKCQYARCPSSKPLRARRPQQSTTVPLTAVPDSFAVSAPSMKSPSTCAASKSQRRTAPLRKPAQALLPGQSTDKESTAVSQARMFKHRNVLRHHSLAGPTTQPVNACSVGQSTATQPASSWCATTLFRQVPSLRSHSCMRPSEVVQSTRILSQQATIARIADCTRGVMSSTFSALAGFQSLMPPSLAPERMCRTLGSFCEETTFSITRPGSMNQSSRVESFGSISPNQSSCEEAAAPGNRCFKEPTFSLGPTTSFAMERPRMLRTQTLKAPSGTSPKLADSVVVAKLESRVGEERLRDVALVGAVETELLEAFSPAPAGIPAPSFD